MKCLNNTIILIKIGFFIISIIFFKETLNAQECNFLENESISLNISGYNKDESFMQTYALVETTGNILEIANMPTFSRQDTGNYYVYALNYDTTTSVNNFVVGENIVNLSGTCFDTTRINITICACSMECNSTVGAIAITNTGYNATPDFNQVYALADTFGLILQTIENPITTRPLFSGIYSGHYHLYAINYDTRGTFTGLTVGNNITAISGDCLDIGVFCYNVCDSNYDLGDLPDISDSTTINDYQTLRSNNGPRHLIIKDLFLGDSIDMELDGQPSGQALGDGADEDGTIFFPTMNLAPGINFRLPFDYTNVTGDTAHLEAWIDWNADGDFDIINEMIIDWEDADTPFPNQMEINIPKDAATETAIGMRIRLSLQDNMSPYGLINSGEVEDYMLYLDCPKVYFPFKLIDE